MGDTLRGLEVVLGLILLATAAWLGFSWYRRVRIAGGHGTALCQLRTPDRTRSAIVRLGPRALELHSLWGTGTTPFAALERTTLEMEWLDEDGPAPGRRWVRVSGRPATPGTTLTGGDLALSHGDGRALRAWQETLPPGHAFSASL